MSEQIKSKLESEIKNYFRVEDFVFRNDLTARDVDGWDSIEHVRFILHLEKAFELSFDAFEIAALENLGDLLALINEKAK